VTALYEAVPGRPNLVATLPGAGGGPTLALCGHTDVLPPGHGWKGDPFSGEIRDGSIWGRGSLDMKAGLAAMTYVAEALVRGRRRLRGDLVLAFVVDEVEGGSKGAGYLADEGLLTADCAVVCEPTGPAACVAHRGAVWTELTVRGTSAHGGRPWQGVNAIGKVALILEAMRSELLPKWQDRTHWILPPPTMNVGTITGGDKFNLVADRCTVTFDRRLVPGETPAGVANEMRAFLGHVQARDPDSWSWSLRVVMEKAPYEIDREAAIVRSCLDAYRSVTGEEAGITATAGFEDAGLLAAAGIPTVMFGPYRPPREGNSTLSGTAEECVSTSDLIRGTDVLLRLVQDVCVVTGP
jgi:acetylornithine deacetylase/succinyl-diaminopimelate desuccinylase family protein